MVDPENHSPVRHRPNTEMRAKPRPGPAPAQLRLGSGSARAQSEPLGRGLGPCKVGLSGESAAHYDPENHSPARLRGTDQTPNTEMQDRPRPEPAPAQLVLGSGWARAQSEPLGRGLGPCKVGFSWMRARPWMIRRIILRRVFVAQTKH